jgi:hypothetical protein
VRFSVLPAQMTRGTGSERWRSLSAGASIRLVHDDREQGDRIISPRSSQGILIWCSIVWGLLFYGRGV